MFGTHLRFTLKDCPQEKLDDLDLINKLLDELPAQIGMTKIAPAYAFRYTGTVPDDYGITAIVMLAESHASFHGFSAKGYAFIDVFSCKEFNSSWVIDHLSEALGPCKILEIDTKTRGREFPRSEVRATQILDDERERLGSNLY